jgi:hypothetical protein
MSQANEALAADDTVKTEEQQQPEPQGLMDEARQNEPVSEETNEQPGDIPHLEPQEEVDDDGPYERPEWYPDKFWDDDGPNLEKLTEAYTNLEKQFHQGKHKAPEGGKYNTEFLGDSVPQDDALLTFFSGWAKDNGISQAAFEGLAGKVMEMGGANAEAETLSIAQEKKMLGENADEIIKSNITWANGLVNKGIISKDELDEIDIWGGTAVGARLLQKVRAMTGENVNIPTTTAYEAGKESEDDFRSRINQKMADPKYGTDPAYTRSVEKEFEDRYK